MRWKHYEHRWRTAKFVLPGATGWRVIPARFQLVLAANLCPCAPADPQDCICAAAAKRRYLGKLSGPLLDRVDLRVQMHPVRAGAFSATDGESTAQVRDRVALARRAAAKRWQPTRISDQCRSQRGAVAPKVPSQQRRDGPAAKQRWTVGCSASAAWIAHCGSRGAWPTWPAGYRPGPTKLPPRSASGNREHSDERWSRPAASVTSRLLSAIRCARPGRISRWSQGWRMPWRTAPSHDRFRRAVPSHATR